MIGKRLSIIINYILISFCRGGTVEIQNQGENGICFLTLKEKLAFFVF